MVAETMQLLDLNYSFPDKITINPILKYKQYA